MIADCELLPFALRWARQCAGLTQLELAEAAKVSLSYVGMMEAGRRRHPSYTIVEAMAYVLRVDARELAVELPPRAPRRSTDPRKSHSWRTLTDGSDPS